MMPRPKLTLHPRAFARACALALLALAACERDPVAPTTSTGGPRRADVGAAAVIVPAGTPSVAVGLYHACALKRDGTVTCWGDNSQGQATPPAGLTGVAQLALGDAFSCALRSDGTVTCWGRNTVGQASPPPDLSEVIGIAVGAVHGCAVRLSGSVVCWGDNYYGQTTPPANLTNAGSIGAGGYHTCVVRSDETVACWGRNDIGQATPPASLSGVWQVDGGTYHSCAAKTDGTVVCWGNPQYGQTSPPADLTEVAMVAGGYGHTCALRNLAPAVTCWGSLGGDVPAGLDLGVLHMGVGWFTTCAAKLDGSVVCWGANNYNVATPPAGLNLLLAQSIAFTSAPPSPAIVGASYAVAASGGGSGNPIVFSSLSPSVCSVSGGSVALLSAGTCTIAADQDGTPGYYLAAPQATQTFTVQRTPQHVIFTTTPPSPAYVGTGYAIGVAGGASGNPVVLTSATPAVCSVTGNAVSLTTVGMCTVAANQAGNDSYEAATEVTQSILVSKRPQEITFTSTPPSPALLGASYDVSASGGASGNPVTFASLTPAVCTLSGTTVSFVGVGACTVAASQAGNASYAPAAQATQSVGVVYPFTGFLGSIVNAPSFNTARAGSTVSLEFSLGGDRGLGVLGAGSPTIVSLPGCGTTPSGLEAPAVVPNRSLTFNKRSGNYTVSFGSDRSWAGSCRQVVVRLSDGTDHRVNFQFVK